MHTEKIRLKKNRTYPTLLIIIIIKEGLKNKTLNLNEVIPGEQVNTFKKKTYYIASAKNF